MKIQLLIDYNMKVAHTINKKMVEEYAQQRRCPRIWLLFCISREKYLLSLPLPERHVILKLISRLLEIEPNRSYVHRTPGSANQSIQFDELMIERHNVSLITNPYNCITSDELKTSILASFLARCIIMRVAKILDRIQKNEWNQLRDHDPKYNIQYMSSLKVVPSQTNIVFGGSYLIRADGYFLRAARSDAAGNVVKKLAFRSSDS